MKIGILKTGHLAAELASRHGDYFDMFSQLLADNEFSFEQYAVVDGTFPDGVHACDGWLITGSAHGVYEDHAFIPPLEAFIREAYSSGVPIAGICFGHQIMAQALGGRVEKFSGGWGVGHSSYETLDGAREIFAMHQDQVIEIPADATVIAKSEFCENAGLAYRGNAISFQPHPEFTAPFMLDLIKFKSGKGLPQERAERALAEFSESNDSALVGQQLIQFFKSAGAEKAA